jgi:hypothetical protein
MQGDWRSRHGKFRKGLFVYKNLICSIYFGLTSGPIPSNKMLSLTPSPPFSRIRFCAGG